MATVVTAMNATMTTNVNLALTLAIRMHGARILMARLNAAVTWVSMVMVSLVTMPMNAQNCHVMKIPLVKTLLDHTAALVMMASRQLT